MFAHFWNLLVDGFAALTGVASLINAAALTPQLFTVWQSKRFEGVNVKCFLGFLIIQLALTADGYKRHVPLQMLGMMSSAIITVLIITRVLQLRRKYRSR